MICYINSRLTLALHFIPDKANENVKQTKRGNGILLGGSGSEATTDGVGIFIAISLFHFSIFGRTSFSQFSIFGKSSPAETAAADGTAVAANASSSVAASADPRGCFLSRRPFSRGGSFPLLPRFCSAWRAAAYTNHQQVIKKRSNDSIRRYKVTAGRYRTIKEFSLQAIPKNSQ